jgi:hypothetical protein
MPRTSDTEITIAPSRAHIAARTGAALLGGYSVAWGVTAATMALLFAAGLDFHDAEFLGCLLGVLAFLAAFLWAFAARHVRYVWIVLLGGGALLTGLALLVQSWLT